MKVSISFFLVAICAMCLAAQQSQAKKGCNAYGYACYGGHGKRSLHTQEGDATGMERPDTIVQVYPNEANMLADGNVEGVPRYKLIKIMKSWFGKDHRRPSSERMREFDYPFSAENNSFK